MQATRFDTMTRRMARGGSRRNLLRGVAGGLATAVFARARGDVAAQPNSVPRGGACYEDRQCINDYYAPGGAGLNPEWQEVYCRDNGFSYDGEWNCCRFSGGFCDRDEECCGVGYCVDGFCEDQSWITAGPNSLPLGSPCVSPEQCDATGSVRTCDYNGIDEGGVCCNFYGNWCDSDGHCCGSMICLDQACTVPYEGYG